MNTLWLLRRTSLWSALAGILAVLLMVHRTTRTEPVPEPPVPPAIKPQPDSLGAAGIVEAFMENTSIGVPVAGLVARVSVRVWDKVRPGDVLLELDDREIRAQLLAEKAEVRVAEAELARLRRQHERTEALRAAGLVSEDEADSLRDDYTIRQARTEAAKATVARTVALLERLVIRAPHEGTVLQVNTRPGEHVTPGAATPPVLLGAIEELQVRAEVDEQIASHVRPGRPALGYLKGDTTRPIDLEFVRIEPFVTPKRNLTGAGGERIDTRVLQVVYKFPRAADTPVYVGQQMDLFLPR